MLFGPLRDAAWIADVRFLRAGLGDGARQGESGNRTERIDKGRVRVGHGEHIRGFNRFPTADGGTVKAEAIGKHVLGQFADRTSEVLPSAESVDKLNIDHPGTLLLGHFYDAFWGTHTFRFDRCFGS